MVKRKVKLRNTHVKGIYISSEVLMNEERLAKVIDLMFQSGLNAVVIDMKDDQGNIANRRLRNFSHILQQFKDNGFYTIARVVAFMDPQHARKRPLWALRRKGGSLWKQGGTGWLDPYRRAVWDHITSVAVSAARLGFDEIQFDQVRFPYNSQATEQDEVSERSSLGTQAQVIGEFLAYAKQVLRPHNVIVSAGVYGGITSAKDDSGIGQKWSLMSPHLDVISPMLYPSLYPNGFYNMEQPEKHPFKVVQRSLFDAKRRNYLLQKKGKLAASIRPWLQDFSSGTAKYGLKEVQSQIRAAKSQGIHEFLLWNGYANYSFGSLQTSTKAKTNRPFRLKRMRTSQTAPFFPTRRK